MITLTGSPGAELAVAHQTIAERIQRAEDRVRVRSARIPRVAVGGGSH